MQKKSGPGDRELSRRNETPSGIRMVRRQYFQLLPYQVLLIAVNAVNGIVDGVFASNGIGQTAMTAIGMFGPFNHLLYALSMMLVSGSQILCGRYIGKDQRKELRNVFSVDLIVSGLISVLIALLMILAALLNWTRLFAPGDAERAALNEYFLGQALGIPGLILGQQMFAFLSMENQTRRTMASTLACVFSNAAVDVLFVSVLRMGTFGLALGTAVSEWIFFGVLASWYRKGKTEMRLSRKDLNWHEVKNIMVLGYPGSLSRFSEMFRCIIVNGLILQYVGSAGLSSFAASNSVMAIFWAIPFGMMAVDRMLMSISIGEEDRKATLDIMRVITRWGVLFILGIAAALCLAAEPLTRLFFRDPLDPVYGMTVTALRMLPFCMPFSVVTQAISVYAQIMEKKMLSTVFPVLNGAVHVVLFSLLLIPAMGMTGLYAANLLNGACGLLVAAAFAAYEKGRIPRNLNDLLAFPESFGIREEDYLEFTVTKEKDVPSVSLRVERFCLDRGIDRRRAVFSGLAVEEMAGNFCARTASLRHLRCLEIRVTCLEKDVMLRLRDNGVSFNPLDRDEGKDAKDPFKDVGVRILMDSAKDVQHRIGIVLTRGISQEVGYRNVLGMNVLMIRI